MTVTYKWEILKIECELIEGFSAKVANKVYWMLTAHNSLNDTSYSISEGTDLLEPNSNSFIPFHELEKYHILQWIKDIMGPEKVSLYETTLATKLNQQEYITTEELLPWQ